MPYQNACEVNELLCDAGFDHQGTCKDEERDGKEREGLGLCKELLSGDAETGSGRLYVKERSRAHRESYGDADEYQQEKQCYADSEYSRHITSLLLSFRHH